MNNIIRKKSFRWCFGTYYPGSEIIGAIHREGGVMIRTIAVEEVTRNIREMCIEANYYLSSDMKAALDDAARAEQAPLGKKILGQLQENLKIAGEEMIPICQDTGMAVVFAEIGQDVHFEGGSLEDAIQERENVQAIAGERQFVKIVEEDMDDCGSQTISPILCEGDAIGAVILFSKDPKAKMGEVEQKLAVSAAGFLGRQMEQ